jgi:hypothetical protein
MIVKLSPSALRRGHWYEYLMRFVLGGAVTASTGVISSRFGAAVGGLFLALPAIFCASATLIARHEEQRKHQAGLHGQRRGQEAAALDAAGAALGSMGMLAFALVFSLLIERDISAGFIAALSAWAVVSVGAWRIWLHLRLSRGRARRASGRLRMVGRADKRLSRPP